MFAVLNIENGDFYSESPALKREAKREGMKWDNTTILPCFAKPFKTHRAALQQSQRLSDSTGCVCAVVMLS